MQHVCSHFLGVHEVGKSESTALDHTLFADESFVCFLHHSIPMVLDPEQVLSKQLLNE